MISVFCNSNPIRRAYCALLLAVRFTYLATKAKVFLDWGRLAWLRAIVAAFQSLVLSRHVAFLLVCLLNVWPFLSVAFPSRCAFLFAAAGGIVVGSCFCPAVSVHCEALTMYAKPQARHFVAARAWFKSFAQGP